MSRGDAIGLILVAVVGIVTAICVAVGLLEFAPTSTDPVDTVGEEDPVFDPVGNREPVDNGYSAVAPEIARSGVAARYSELNDLAIEALEEGRLEEAVILFEECLGGEPQEPVFAANLAEALTRLARLEYTTEPDLSIAIERLERAVELAPSRDELAQLLERWKKVAETEADFWTDETEHFLLSYDGSRSDLLHRGYSFLTGALESAYSDFGEVFNRYPVSRGDPKIRVVIYRRDEFADLTGIGHWAGGVYDGVVRVPVVDFDTQRAELERVLRHELLHAFVKTVGGAEVPAWLNEGLAQWHETIHLDERRARVDRARSRLTGGSLFPLDELKGSLSRWTDEEKIERGYAQSLALVAYLDRWYGERILYEMVEGCGRGRDCRTTFHERIGIDLDQVLTDLEGSL